MTDEGNSDPPTCLGVITARGGSKGIPGKNIRPVGGRPLIEHTIEVGLKSSHVTETMVTTDDPEIRDVAQRCGAETPFLRPAELATDTAKQEDAILHAMAWYEEQDRAFDLVCLLEPTIPLRQVETLDHGFDLLADRPDADAVFSVVEVRESPIHCNTLPEDGLMRDWMDDRYKTLQRQEIPTFYYPSALVTISRWETFKEEGTFLHDRTLAMPVDRVEAQDLDDPFDLLVVEALMERGIRAAEDLEREVLG